MCDACDYACTERDEEFHSCGREGCTEDECYAPVFYVCDVPGYVNLEDYDILTKE
jgi:hypothetical protein